MLISIIIPFRNSAKYIKQSINSVINQSLSNKYYEIIAINDCSSDKSTKIVKRIFNNKLNCKLLTINEKTIGPGLARNLGIKYSSGQYIYFLDSDDFLKRQTLLKLKKIIDKNKKVDLICNGYKVFDKKKNMKKITRFDLDLLKENKDSILKNFFRLSIIPQVISNLISKRLIIKNNIFFKEGYFEDVYFIFRVLFYLKKKIIIKESLYFKNNRKNSIVNTLSTQHINDAFKGYNSAYKLLSKKKKYKEFIYYLYMKAIVGETSILINRIKTFGLKNENKKKYYKELYNVIKENISWLRKKYKFETKKDIIFKNFIENTSKYF